MTSSSKSRPECFVNQWNCVAIALAYSLDIPYPDLITVIGHDGSEILWPSLSPPRCYKGFTPQDVLRAGLDLGIPIVHLKATETLYGDTLQTLCHSLDSYLDKYNGVVVGQTDWGRHAMAIVDSKIMDVTRKGVVERDRNQINVTDFFAM